MAGRPSRTISKILKILEIHVDDDFKESENSVNYSRTISRLPHKTASVRAATKLSNSTAKLLTSVNAPVLQGGR